MTARLLLLDDSWSSSSLGIYQCDVCGKDFETSAEYDERLNLLRSLQDTEEMGLTDEAMATNG